MCLYFVLVYSKTKKKRGLPLYPVNECPVTKSHDIRMLLK